MRLDGRDFLSIGDLNAEELTYLLDLADRLKKGEQSRALEGRSVALLFEHPSLRTRLTFDLGVQQLGGHGIYMSPSEVNLGEREGAPDIARNLERWVQCIVARVRYHSSLVELAQAARVPVVNALSDREHPCQALADFQTLRERLGSLPGAVLLYCGDGNNVCHSLLLAGAKLGVSVWVATPPAFEPRTEIVAAARQEAQKTGASIRVERNAEALAGDADALYTDVWASMGQESEKEQRRRIFLPYQINERLLSKAKPGALVMHCLPAHRGEEITEGAIDGPQSVVFDQAENRLHAQKALLSMLL
ncbi:MAG TPA: ornithine carbamoyltransferase [Chloroflexota bacterium]|nr:ornithine carbamoyltransferase [Chloroflexota bacterium]